MINNASVIVPTLSAKRVGNHVEIHYRFSGGLGRGTRRTWVLFTAEQSADQRIPRLSTSTALRRSSGTITLPKSRGPGPYTIIYSVLTKGGQRSTLHAVRVR
jgi:hypothetical protein